MLSPAAPPIGLAETQYCPVWAMLKGGGTRITSCFEIAGSAAVT